MSANTKETAKRQLFGTDGIRGAANLHPMTPELALRLGRAITYVAQRQHGRRQEGTDASTVALHSTWVPPISISTDPSG